MLDEDRVILELKWYRWLSIAICNIEDKARRCYTWLALVFTRFLVGSFRLPNVFRLGLSDLSRMISSEDDPRMNLISDVNSDRSDVAVPDVVGFKTASEDDSELRFRRFGMRPTLSRGRRARLFGQGVTGVRLRLT